MAFLRSYSATFEQTTFAQAAVTRWRFNEGAGTTALDSVDALDGNYQTGAAPGAAGSIGDGAASFDGSTGFVLVETLSGTITVSAFGDSLMDGDGFQASPDQFSPGLQAALEARGLDATVIERAENGQRTGDALNPGNDSLFTVAEVTADDPDVVILELGTNDALIEINPGTVEANLREIIADLQAGGVDQILLAGAFGFYPNRPAGRPTGYDTVAERDAFEGVYAQIAGDTPGVTLLNGVDGDKFLGGARIENGATTIQGGVLDSANSSLRTGDGLHPNAAGIDFIVPRLVPQTIALGAAAGVVNEPLLLANGAFEMWFTLDELGQEQTLISKNSAGQGTGGQVAVLVRPDGVLTFALGSETTDLLVNTDPGAVQAGEATHLVANFGTDGMHVFINGEEASVTGNGIDHSGGLIGNFEQLVIGAATSSSTPGTIDAVSQFFDGTIDEFGIYDRALSAGEVEQLFDGGQFGTTVVGTAKSDDVIGGDDDEDLRGAGGNDLIEGNGGDDVLRGAGGADDLLGAAGNDRLLGGGGADDLRGGPGDDALRGMGGHDLIIGSSGDDLLQGGGGKDTLGGSGGADELFGERSNDALSGGAGDDLLNGGPGRDTLTGGPGSDTFQIDRISHGLDKIRDFEDGPGGDVLDLSAVLSFGGADDFNDFVRLDETGNSTRVEVNADGAGSDFRAVFNLRGTTGLDIATLLDDGNVRLEPPPTS
jgi:lysophospholipase L1-like esterase